MVDNAKASPLKDPVPQAPRVLHVYSGNLYGGVETFLTTLARRTDLAGALGRTFALCFEGRLGRELRDLGADVPSLGAVRLSRPWTVLAARRRLRGLLQARRPEVVICHSPWTQGLFGPVVRAAGLPLVFYLHGPVAGGHWTDRLARRTPPDLMIAVSRHTLETGRLIYPTVDAAVVHYPIPWADEPDETDRAGTRAALDTPADAVVILQASRLDRWKGQDLLIDALTQISDVPGWVAWFAGGVQRPADAVFLAELKRQAGARGLDGRVRFLGERRDVPRLLAAADIYCQANRGAEGFSLAFMEACHAGRPVVTTALGGAPELVDGSCGVLARPGDVDGLADGLRRLVVDQDLRRGLGAAARAKVRQTSDPAAQIGALSDLLAGLARPAAAVS